MFASLPTPWLMVTLHCRHSHTIFYKPCIAVSNTISAIHNCDSQWTERSSLYCLHVNFCSWQHQKNRIPSGSQNTSLSKKFKILREKGLRLWLTNQKGRPWRVSNEKPNESIYPTKQPIKNMAEACCKAKQRSLQRTRNIPTVTQNT